MRSVSSSVVFELLPSVILGAAHTQVRGCTGFSKGLCVWHNSVWKQKAAAENLTNVAILAPSWTESAGPLSVKTSLNFLFRQTKGINECDPI